MPTCRESITYLRTVAGTILSDTDEQVRVAVDGIYPRIELPIIVCRDCNQLEGRSFEGRIIDGRSFGLRGAVREFVHQAEWLWRSFENVRPQGVLPFGPHERQVPCKLTVLSATVSSSLRAGYIVLPVLGRVRKLRLVIGCCVKRMRVLVCNSGEPTR